MCGFFITAQYTMEGTIHTTQIMTYTIITVIS